MVLLKANLLPRPPQLYTFGHTLFLEDIVISIHDMFESLTTSGHISAEEVPLAQISGRPILQPGRHKTQQNPS